ESQSVASVASFSEETEVVLKCPGRCAVWNRLNRRDGLLIFAAVCLAAIFGWADTAKAQGGEPRYFAITNARVVPVSGPVIENGTVVIGKGLIQAVGASVTIPAEAWVIDGKGLTVYPGLIDAGTNIGLPKEEGGGKAPAPVSKGPEDRPGTTPWR